MIQHLPPSAQSVSFSLSEKVWLLDFSKKNPKVNSEDCGKALAAEVNANVPEHEKRKAPTKNTVNGWKKSEAQLRAQHEKECAQGTTGKVRSREAKHAQMEEALYVWFRQMQGRDMLLTEEIIREKAKQIGAQLNVPECFGYSAGWLHSGMASANLTCCMAKQALLTKRALSWRAADCVSF
jgi:hypothetical protein